MLRKYVAASVLVILVFCAGAMVFAGTPEKKDYSQNLIRFHVIANSDTTEDQQLKREVRDAILAQVGTSFQKVETVSQARKVVNSKLRQMEVVARQVLTSHGKEYPVDAQLGHFHFPAKTYGDFSLPAGRYEAVRIVLGEGKGENWWCVLFPPLCFVDISNNLATETQAVEVSKDLHSMEPHGTEDKQVPVIQLKFKFLEVLDRSKGFIAEWRPKERDRL